MSRKKIEPLTVEEIAAMRRKTVINIPNDASASGMSAGQLKQAFVSSTLGDKDSLLEHLGKIIEQQNEVNDTLTVEIAAAENGGIEVSKEEPNNKKVGRVWFKIFYTID